MGGRETSELIKKKKKTARKSKKPSSVESCEKVKLDDKVEKESEKSIGKKRKKEKTCSIDAGDANEIAIADNSNKITGEKKKKKAKKNKRDEQIVLVDHHGDNADKDNSNQIVREKKKKKLKKDKIEKEEQIVQVHDHGEKAEEGIPKKAKKKKKNNKNRNVTSEGETFSNKSDKEEEDEVYHISSVDEDHTRGMKKWITEYHQTRPGLKVLQQQIDEFITAHKAKLEQERKERQARDEAEGWTVVSHHKGRKKTTDSESGITMGAVSLAAVSEFRDEKEKKLMKKKQTEALPEFYRFQRKEAQMNEILSLQSKFEQDKKKIQQLRAARKFRPY